LGRGFVADSERIASSIRAELGIGPTAKLPLELAAKIYGARVVSAANLVDMSRLVELERIQAFAFSACTFDVDGIPVIVFNPLRSEPRRQSDVAHELSHLILKHDLSEIREVAGLPFRTCRADQEEEATALGGALLLPRPLLLRATSRGMSADEIAQTYAVTVEMARFRVNTTGG
jgi:Zn-dependent peptidase ImmA (M78 family)